MRGKKIMTRKKPPEKSADKAQLKNHPKKTPKKTHHFFLAGFNPNKNTNPRHPKKKKLLRFGMTGPSKNTPSKHQTHQTGAISPGQQKSLGCPGTSEEPSGWKG